MLRIPVHGGRTFQAGLVPATGAHADEHDPGTEGSLDLVQMWQLEPRRSYLTIGSWPLPLERMIKHDRGGTLVNVSAGPRAEPFSSPRLARLGYQLVVRLENRRTHAIISVTVTVGRAGALAAAEPHIEARVLRGDTLVTRIGLGGRPDEGPLVGHVVMSDRYGESTELQLAWLDPAEPDAGPVLARMPLELRQLRRGFPEEFSGAFTLDYDGDGLAEPWRYRVWPNGTGIGPLLVIEVERTGD